MAAFAPVAAVTAAALVLLPLVAAERFSRSHEPDDDDRDSDSPAETAADAPGETTGEAEVDPTEQPTSAGDDSAPIAIDSRKRNGRDPAERERAREERGERVERDRSERERSREERNERRIERAARVERSRSTTDEPLAAIAAEPMLADGGAEIASPGPDEDSSGPDGQTGVMLAANGEQPGADSDGPAETQATSLMPAPPLELQHETARRSLLVTPIVDSLEQSPRALERARVHQETAEKAILSSPEVTAAVAPLIRHLNTITVQLNESQIAIGRMTAERDALRQRLVAETGALAEQIDRQTAIEVGEPDRRQKRQARLESRANHRDHDRSAAEEPEDEPGKVRLAFQRIGFVIPDEASEEEFKKAAHKRQVIAVVFLAIIGIFLWLYQSQGNELGNFSRESLAQIAFIGSFMQVFLVAWLMYRVIRVGSRGARWVFPKQNTKRRRR